MYRVTKQYLKRKWPGDHRMHELIDYIMPVIYYLHQEYLNNAGAEVDSEYDWKRNIVDLEVKMVAALGHGHEMHGDLSTILGAFGNITQAYKEIIAGGYATDVPGNATAWEPDDRLFTIGMGIDADNRADALTLYKNGFLELMNAVVIGAFSSSGMLPKDGAVQYITKRLELYFDEEWHPLAFLSDIKPPATITSSTTNETTEEHHTHALDNVITAGTKGSKGKPLSITFDAKGRLIEVTEDIHIIHQPGHGFAVKNVIRDTGSTFVLAIANNAENAQACGYVVEVIDVDNFIYQSGGYFDHPDFVRGEEHFLSPVTAGLSCPEHTWTYPDDAGKVRQHLGFVTDRGLKIEIDVGDEIGGGDDGGISEVVTEKHVVGTGLPDNKIRLYGDVEQPITAPNKYYGTKDGSDETFHSLPEEAVQILSGITPTFDMENGRGATITLTADSTITFANLKANDNGHIEVKQDAIGGHRLVFAGVTVEISEYSFAAQNEVQLTGVAGSNDVVAWWYTGSVMKLAVIYNFLSV